MAKFAEIIANKDILLFEAPPGRSFFLSDHPVVLHNDVEPQSIFSNIGISVKGIQFYLPLSSRYMLGAWCPSIIAGLKADADAAHADLRRLEAAALLSPDGSNAVAREDIEFVKRQQAAQVELIGKLRCGSAVKVEEVSMDFYNSLQTHFASEFIVCGKDDESRIINYLNDHEG